MTAYLKKAVPVCALALFLSAPVMAQDHGHDGAALWDQADQYFDPDAMAEARAAVLHHGTEPNLFLMADRFELQSHGSVQDLVWDAQGWWGGDLDKLWVKSEGHYSLDDTMVEEGEFQALWSHAISPFFDLQTGLRVDFEPGTRTHAVVGFQGLAPYWFEVDVAAFLSDRGDLTARAEIEYEILLTQRLILQPRAELNFSAQDIAEDRLGRGLSNTELGLRLRYEIRREFAPYIGVDWSKAYGRTADYLRADEEGDEHVSFVAGIRAWF